MLCKATAPLTIVLSILSMSLKYSVKVGLYTMFIGFIVALWEFPVIYVCVSQYTDKAKEFCLETLQVKRPLLKAILYIGLSIYMFFNKSVCIAAGLLFILCSLLLIFTAINRSSDALDSLPSHHESGGSKSAAATEGDSKGLLGNNKFGTF